MKEKMEKKNIFIDDDGKCMEASEKEKL